MIPVFKPYSANKDSILWRGKAYEQIGDKRPRPVRSAVNFSTPGRTPTPEFQSV